MARVVLEIVNVNAKGEPLTELVFHDDASQCVQDPLDHNKWLTAVEHVTRLNQDSNLREVGGWHIAKQHADETEPKTRWQRLVDHVNGPDGNPELKALNLSTGVTTNESSDVPEDVDAGNDGRSERRSRRHSKGR